MRPGTVLFATTCFLAVGTASAAAADRIPIWQLYTNPRFTFSVHYPQDWQLGDPLPDGMGVTLFPPQPKSQVALSGFLNVSEGTNPDGRQTLEEFAAAHRRIINELYGQKNISVKWEQERHITLGGQPAEQLTFSYHDESKTPIIEMHIFSLGRNEGRGVRIKYAAEYRTTLMPTIAQLLQTYQPGRDQNAVSPFAPAGK